MSGFYKLKVPCTQVRLAILKGFPGGASGKEPACQCGDRRSTSGLGRSPEGGNGNPLQYSSLGNPMDKGIWQATVLGVTEELDTT